MELAMSKVQTIKRKGDALQPGDRYQWQGRWYVLGERAGLPMAICLEPNAPNGTPGTSGHAPPLTISDVEILI
jgi:hypothetical protein